MIRFSILRPKHGLALAAFAGVLSFTQHLPAQPAQATSGWSQRVAVGIVHQADADLEFGGSFDVTRFFASVDISRATDEATMIGFGLGAGHDAYGFSEIASPWQDLTRFEASLSYTRRLSGDWTLRLSPSVQTYYEDGASASDGVVAGLVASATHTFNPDLRLGLGAAMFTGLEETRVFPFLAIQWEISETWTLQNPFRPGPAGPAGLEFVRTGDTWDFGFGGAYRSYRFALRDDGPVSEGIGEYNGVPLFARATRKLNDTWELDLYAGLVVGGSLELENNQGDDLADIEFDPAPLAAVTLSGRF